MEVLQNVGAFIMPAVCAVEIVLLAIKWPLWMLSACMLFIFALIRVYTIK
jgi:hypothetical protein